MDDNLDLRIREDFRNAAREAVQRVFGHDAEVRWGHPGLVAVGPYVFILNQAGELVAVRRQEDRTGPPVRRLADLLHAPKFFPPVTQLTTVPDPGPPPASAAYVPDLSVLGRYSPPPPPYAPNTDPG